MNVERPSTTTTSPHNRRPVRSPRTGWVWGVALALAVGAAASYTVGEGLYTRAVRWVAGSGLGSGIDLVATQGLWALVALSAVVAVWAFVRDRRRFWIMVSAGAGVIAAYALSEGIKILVAEPRPCVGSDVVTVIACPAAGDWSWPSNHAVLAACFATACVLALPRAGWIAIPLAITIAASRVLAGVHYVHDVLSGLALGMVVVAGAVVVLRLFRDRMIAGTGTAAPTGALA